MILAIWFSSPYNILKYCVVSVPTCRTFANWLARTAGKTELVHLEAILHPAYITPFCYSSHKLNFPLKIAIHRVIHQSSLQTESFLTTDFGLTEPLCTHNLLNHICASNVRGWLNLMTSRFKLDKIGWNDRTNESSDHQGNSSCEMLQWHQKISSNCPWYYHQSWGRSNRTFCSSEITTKALRRKSLGQCHIEVQGDWNVSCKYANGSLVCSRAHNFSHTRRHRV